MNKYILPIACIAYIILCTRCMVDKTFLDEAEIAWFQCYDKGDTLIFQSKNHKQIILKVDTISVYNPRNHNPFDWEGMSIYHYFEISNDINGRGVIGISEVNKQISKKRNGNIPDIYFRIEKSGIYYDDGLQIYFGDAAVYDYGRKFLNKAKESYMSNNKDCIFRASDYMIEKDPNDSITDFVWSRERGLLSFTVRDTATYQFIERIPRNKSSATGLQ